MSQLLSTLVKDGKIKQIYGVITGHARAARERGHKEEALSCLASIRYAAGKIVKTWFKTCLSIYINRIRMFVCLSVGYTLLIKPNSIHMLYMGRSGIYRGRFLPKN